MSGARLRSVGDFRWEGVAVEPYKEVGPHFHDVSRQVLFGGSAAGASELRYFEVGPGGWTTLERHQHVHQVMVLRGAGRALVGDALLDLAPHDLVSVPPRTWHQFRAAETQPLGFLCLVDRERDRPERPTDRDLADLRRTPTLAQFIRP